MKLTGILLNAYHINKIEHLLSGLLKEKIVFDDVVDIVYNTPYMRLCEYSDARL